MEENPQPVTTTTTEQPETTVQATSKIGTNKIALLVIVLILLTSLSAYAYTQFVQPEDGKIGNLLTTPSPTQAAEPTTTPAPTLTPKPTLSMSFQEIIDQYCTKVNYNTGGYSYTFDVTHLPLEIDASVTITENNCSTLAADSGGFGTISVKTSAGINAWIINADSIEPGHGGPSYWRPEGKEVYSTTYTKMYAYLPVPHTGPGMQPDEVYLDIRGIKDITLSNGESITLIVTHSPLVPNDNQILTEIMSKYTKVVDAPAYDEYGIEVIDYSKSDQYYTEIYNAFFKDMTKTDTSIQTTYNEVLSTLNAIEGK